MTRLFVLSRPASRWRRPKWTPVPGITTQVDAVTWMLLNPQDTYRVELGS